MITTQIAAIAAAALNLRVPAPRIPGLMGPRDLDAEARFAAYVGACRWAVAEISRETGIEARVETMGDGQAIKGAEAIAEIIEAGHHEKTVLAAIASMVGPVLSFEE